MDEQYNDAAAQIVFCLHQTDFYHHYCHQVYPHQHHHCIWGDHSFSSASKKRVDIFHDVCHYGGGGGVVSVIRIFSIFILFKIHLESFPVCKNVFCT